MHGFPRFPVPLVVVLRFFAALRPFALAVYVLGIALVGCHLLIVFGQRDLVPMARSISLLRLVCWFTT
jgi:hypothetical protein